MMKNITNRQGRKTMYYMGKIVRTFSYTQTAYISRWAKKQGFYNLHFDKNGNLIAENWKRAV